MMGPRAVALAVVFSSFGPGAVIAKCGETAPDTAARADAVAPDITLVNLAGDTARLAALRGVPTSVFIDRHGLVRYVDTGPLTADTLESRLNDILTAP